MKNIQILNTNGEKVSDINLNAKANCELGENI